MKSSLAFWAVYLPCSCGAAKFLGDARKLPSFDSDSKELDEYLEAAVLGAQWDT